MSKRYNLKNIRTLLNEGFTDEELRRLCYDISEFRAVYDQLSQTTGKTAIIDRLLEHADRQLQLENLLRLAKEGNPARYAQHQPYYQANIFISYKRNVEPDTPLTMHLYERLGKAGHKIFIDQEIKIGVDWASEIKRQIEASDFMLVLLSPSSVNSEMVAEEVKHAYRQFQRTGKPRLLPVRVNYSEPLPYQLSHYLDRLQYAEWHNQVETDRLVGQLLDALNDIDSLTSPPTDSSCPVSEEVWTTPKPFADPRFIESLRDPSGAVRLRSEFYIEREGDVLLQRELVKPYGTTTTIRAPRQTGKSSLLIRGVAPVQSKGSKVVLLDLQPVDNNYLESLDTFLRYFMEYIVVKLRLDSMEVEKAWRSTLGPSDKASYLMEDYILPEAKAKIVLAIDEADRLLRTHFHDTFFGLLRYWHNNRAMNEVWDNLDIVMAISTEPHLLISDVSQSPFNVGLTIRLQDFDEPQLHDLNQRYRSPLTEQQIPVFMEFLGGHPYLTRKTLHTLVTQNLTWEEMVPILSTEASPVGDHLRRYLWLISQQPDLKETLNHIILRGKCPDEKIYYRLLRAGLVKGNDSKTCQCRCRLYEIYFKEKLQ